MTTLPDIESPPITLRGGKAVSRHALQLFWALEHRRFALALDDGRLIVTPGSRLTARDDRAIRRHRDELVMLVQYCEVVA